MAETVIGVIGGSGLYEMDGLTDVQEVRLDTPFGAPSDAFITGVLEDVKMVFLPRHGRGHRLLPSEVPYRANIHGMKQLGVERIISVSAVGSMREAIVPGHIVIPNQFFDRTQGKRDATFFGEGVVGHVQFADPVCSDLSRLLAEASQAVGATVHPGGTYLCIEGPNFSTRAESNIYRSWGVDVIGMTNIPEARLAREAEICYATLALATDYDCWHEGHDDVSVEAVIAIMQQNVATARRIVAETVRRISSDRACACGEALRYAIMTVPEHIPAATRKKLALLLDRYL
jgi:5'-methylthioadenosine phosphorylase